MEKTTIRSTYKLDDKECGLICNECDRHIHICDTCYEPFMLDDIVYCSGEHGHYCQGCGEDTK
jgi:hypothetical protein